MGCTHRRLGMRSFFQLLYRLLEVTHAQPHLIVPHSTSTPKNTLTLQIPTNSRPFRRHFALRLDLHWFIKHSDTDSKPLTHTHTCTPKHTHDPLPHILPQYSRLSIRHSFLDMAIVLMISAIKTLSLLHFTLTFKISSICFISPDFLQSCCKSAFCLHWKQMIGWLWNINQNNNCVCFDSYWYFWCSNCSIGYVVGNKTFSYHGKNTSLSILSHTCITVKPTCPLKDSIRFLLLSALNVLDKKILKINYRNKDVTFT